MAKRKTNRVMIIIIAVVLVLFLYKSGLFSREAMNPPGEIPEGTSGIANMVYSDAWTSVEYTQGACQNIVSIRSSDATGSYGSGSWLAVDAGDPAYDGIMEGFVFDRVVQSTDSTPQGAAVYDNTGNKIKDKAGNWINRWYNPTTGETEIWVYKGEQWVGEICTSDLGDQYATCNDQMKCTDSCYTKQCTSPSCIVEYRTTIIHTQIGQKYIYSDVDGEYIAIDTNNDGALESFKYGIDYTTSFGMNLLANGCESSLQILYAKTPDGASICGATPTSVKLYYRRPSDGGVVQIRFVPTTVTPSVDFLLSHPVEPYASNGQESSPTSCCHTTYYKYYAFKPAQLTSAQTSRIPVPTYYNYEKYSTNYTKYYCTADKSQIKVGLCAPYTYSSLVQDCDFNECGDPNIGNMVDEAKCSGSRPYKINSKVCVPQTDGTGILYESDSTGTNLIKTTCAEGCGPDNICKQCNPPSYRCNGNVQQSCSSTNQWVDDYECKVGCTPQGSILTTPTTCTQTCSPSAYYCTAVSGGMGVSKCDTSGETISPVTLTGIGTESGYCINGCEDCVPPGCTSYLDMCTFQCEQNVEECVGNVRTKCILSENDYVMSSIGTCSTFEGNGGCVESGSSTSCANVCPDGRTSGQFCYTTKNNISSIYSCTNLGKNISLVQSCPNGCDTDGTCKTYCELFDASSGDNFCISSTKYTCNSDESGTTGAGTFCPNGCVDGVCQALCTPNTEECRQGDIWSCDSTGQSRTILTDCNGRGCITTLTGPECNSICGTNPKNIFYCCGEDSCYCDGNSINITVCEGLSECNPTTGRCAIGCTPGTVRCTADGQNKERCNTAGTAYEYSATDSTLQCVNGCNLGACIKVCDMQTSPDCSSDGLSLNVCGCNGDCISSPISCSARCYNDKCDTLVFNLQQTTFPFDTSIQIPIEVRYSPSGEAYSGAIRAELKGPTTRLFNSVPVANGLATLNVVELVSGGQYNVSVSVTTASLQTIKSEFKIYLSKDVVVSASQTMLWLDELNANQAFKVFVKDGTDPAEVDGLTISTLMNGAAITATSTPDPIEAGVYLIRVPSAVIGNLSLNITPYRMVGGQQMLLTTSPLRFDVAKPAIKIESNMQKSGSKITINAQLTSRGESVDADTVTALVSTPDGTETVILTKIRTGLYSGEVVTDKSGQYTIEVSASRAGYQDGKQASNVFVGDHCSNNIKDGDETDVDCGGQDCKSCESIDIPAWAGFVGIAVIIAIFYFLGRGKKGRRKVK